MAAAVVVLYMCCTSVLSVEPVFEHYMNHRDGIVIFCGIGSSFTARACARVHDDDGCSSWPRGVATCGGD